MTPWPDAMTLEGSIVRLELLHHNHLTDLCEAIADGDLHLLWYTMIPSAETMAAEIKRRLSLRAQGAMLPFAVIDKTSGKAVGMTTYMNIDPVTPRLEIGSTWYCKSVQRTGLNTECKFLLLEHAFEALGCLAVEFRTHKENKQSRRAIERLGALYDGMIRAHMVMANGSIRDTVVYSITAPEWPDIKAKLTQMRYQTYD